MHPTRQLRAVHCELLVMISHFQSATATSINEAMFQRSVAGEIGIFVASISSEAEEAI